MFFLRKIFSFLIVLSIVSVPCLYAKEIAQKNDCQTQIEEINKEIKYMEDLKRGLEGRAIRYENQAQRLQFKSDQLVESKRFWQMAEQNRQMAKELDQKILEKQQEKQRILRECS